jgi:hypothetical protein
VSDPIPAGPLDIERVDLRVGIRHVWHATFVVSVTNRGTEPSGPVTLEVVARGLQLDVLSRAS